MSLSSYATHKILVLNADKSRGIWVEFPPDMQTEELLKNIDEIRDALIAGIEADKKKKEEAPKEEPQAPVSN
jgi:hypothetical protein